MRQMTITIALMATACSKPQTIGSCPQALMSTQPLPTLVGKSSPALGGFLVSRAWTNALAGARGAPPDREIRCTAQLLPKDQGGYLLLTARHCTPWNKIESSRFAFFADDGFTEIPIAIERAKLATSIRADKDLSPEEKVELSQAYKKIIETRATANSRAKEKNVFISLDDVDILEVTLGGMPSDIAAILERSRVLFLAALAKDVSSERMLLKAWGDVLRSSIESRNRASLARLIGRLDACTPDSQTALCKDPAKARAALQRAVRSDELNLFESEESRSDAIAKGESEKQARNTAWAGITPLLKLKPTAVYVQTNATGQGGALGFISVPSESVFGRNMVKEYDYDGIIFKQSPNSNATLIKGDSGSIFSFKGLYPLVALSAVGDESTSGGASVVALPPRKKRDTPLANSVGNAQPTQSAPTSGVDSGSRTAPGKAPPAGGNPYAGGGIATQEPTGPSPSSEQVAAGTSGEPAGSHSGAPELDAAVCL